METLYVLRGTTTQRKDNTLRITLEDGKKRMLPVQSIGHLVIPTSCKVTTDVLGLLGKSGVRVSIVNYYGQFVGSVEPAFPHTSGSVHLAQARLIFDMARRMDLARTILNAGSINCISNLRYYLYRRKPELEPFIKAMDTERQKFALATSPEQLMAYEGRMRQNYYRAWEHIHPLLKLSKRTRQPPEDRINALISFANSIIYATCRHELSKTHLDNTLSVLHAPTQARASLALDLAEVFKPAIADRAIFRMVTRGELDDSDFEEHPGVCLLSKRGKNKIIDNLRESLDLVEIQQYVGYRAIILREAYKIEAHILELEEYDPFIRRA